MKRKAPWLKKEVKMTSKVADSANDRMQKCIHSLKVELGKIRTGRAHPGLLEHIHVSYYGNDTPISQVANIAVENARTLAVTPWEKNMVEVVEKAIRESDLGLNPATAGNVIRVPLPQLTEERRKDLIKLVKEEAERARVAVRNVRRDANNEVKDQLKAKEISEDDERRLENDIQKVTDKSISDIDKVIEAKEAEILEI